MTMLKRFWAPSLIVLLLVSAGCSGAPGAGRSASQVGPRPELFEFPPLDFTPPKPEQFRTVLSNGLVVYMAEDHQIPWFQAALLTPLTARGGAGGSNWFLEPNDKLGVQNLTATVMRTGGTTKMTGEQIDERMEFLAGNVSATNLSIHMRHVDEGLAIWLDILTNPAFPEDKLRREKEQILVAIRNRNRNVSTVGRRTFMELVYGADSPVTAEATEAITNGISRRDLVAWHQKYWGANNAVLVVAGDFDKGEMLKKLEATLGKWRQAEKAVPNYPKVEQASPAGVYMVQPEGAVPNQGVIYVGHVGLTRDDPDYPAVDLMNYTLGGGSFSSRITQVVRNDQGLAYSTNSSFPSESHYPGTFQAFCQTKNSTVVFATQLILDEIERMRNGDVDESELRLAKNARINAFPTQLVFSSLGSIAEGYASLEFDGRRMDHYATYLERYEKVTLADIRRVARKYLRPSDMSILIAGNIEECRRGAGSDLPNQGLIDQMAAKYGGRSIDGLARRFGDGKLHIVTLE